ncbi:MAG: hypothetical protein U1G05_18450 [Kiritimatiellia bacterium]
MPRTSTAAISRSGQIELRAQLGTGDKQLDASLALSPHGGMNSRDSA